MIALFITSLIIFLFILVLEIHQMTNSSDLEFTEKQMNQLLSEGQVGSFITSESKIKIDGDYFTKINGIIKVPENYSINTNRYLILPFQRYTVKTQEQRETILYLGGGPGLSNQRYIPPKSLLKSHDVLLIGYRGMDGSVILDSPEIEKALLGVDNNILSDDSLKLMNSAALQFKIRMKSQGVDISQYNIGNVIEDAETLRKALNISQFNLMSLSYGTRVSLIYQSVYPNQINKSIMESVNVDGGFIWYPEIIDDQLQQFSEVYATTSCHNPYNSIKLALSHMPKRWNTILLDPGKIKIMTFVGLFNTQMASGIIDAYCDASRGDYSGLALMSMTYNIMVPKMFIWGALLTHSFSADDKGALEMQNLISDDNTLLGSPISELLWSMSETLDIETLSEHYQIADHIVQPTLIISGDLDISTPRTRITNYLSRFDDVEEIVISHAGHVNKYPQQKETIEQVLSDFLSGTDFRNIIIDEQPIQTKPTFIFHFSLIAKLVVFSPLFIAVLLFKILYKIKVHHLNLVMNKKIQK